MGGKALGVSFTVDAVATPAAITSYAAVTDMTSSVTKAEGEAVSAALAVAVTEVTALRAELASVITALKEHGLMES